MSQPTTRRRTSPRHLVALALGLAGGALFVVACSLGDGVTPTCDPTAPASDPNACDLRVACDDGRGGVAATDACCLEAVQFLVDCCTQSVATADWRTECGANGRLTTESCSFVDQDIQDKTPNVGVAQGAEVCAMATDAFDHCMAGGFTYVPPTGAGGSGGTTGVGGGGGGTSTGGTGGTGTGGTGGN